MNEVGGKQDEVRMPHATKSILKASSCTSMHTNDDITSVPTDRSIDRQKETHNETEAANVPRLLMNVIPQVATTSGITTRRWQHQHRQHWCWCWM